MESVITAWQQKQAPCSRSLPRFYDSGSICGMSEAAKSVPITTNPPPIQSSTALSEDGDEWSLLKGLEDRERTFVRGLLLGKDPSDAAKDAGWRSEEGAAKLYGRASVRQALEQLAPLIAAQDPKRAARLLMPYWVERLYRTCQAGSDAQSTGAIKELIALAGVNSTRVEHLHASLADVVAAIETRQKSAKALPPRSVTTVPAQEIAPEDTDTESVATSDAAIWGDDRSPEVAPLPVESKPAARSVPKKRGGARGGRRSRPKPGGVGD